MWLAWFRGRVWTLLEHPATAWALPTAHDEDPRMAVGADSQIHFFLTFEGDSLIPALSRVLLFLLPETASPAFFAGDYR